MMQASKKKRVGTMVTAFGWLGVTTKDAVFEVLIMEGKKLFQQFLTTGVLHPKFCFTIAVCDLWLATLFFKRFSNLAVCMGCLF